MVEEILEKKFNKQEILNQIGLKDDEELKDLINKEIEIKDIKSNNENNFYNVEINITNYDKFYILKKNCSKKKGKSIKGHKETIKERKNKLLIDKNLEEYAEDCHRGHLIAAQFKAYTEYSDFNFSKNNPENIYPQWINANLNRAYKSEIHGQAHFENIVIDLLEKGNTILYKVVPIFKKSKIESDFEENNFYPIGNLIIAIMKDEEKLKGNYSISINEDDIKNDFCVFIPNYLDTKIYQNINTIN